MKRRFPIASASASSFWPVLLAALVLSSLPRTFGGGADDFVPASLPAVAVPRGLTASDWTKIRAAHEAWRHAPISTASGYRARNPGQQWRIDFARTGWSVEPKLAGWRWGLELKSYGCACGERYLSKRSDPAVRDERIIYQLDENVQEWLINDERGLEHGFNISKRPPMEAEGILELNFAVQGGLRAEVSGDGAAVTFQDSNGVAVITYTALKVWDADGKLLPAQFESSSGGGQLRLCVDERSARYPLVIDPIAQQAYVKASNTGADDEFGTSIAVSSDTVVVGARFEDSNATGVNGDQSNNSAPSSGAAYVFVRSGGTWSQQAYLKASNTDHGDEFGSTVAISGDTIVVGAASEASNATGVNGNQADNSAASAGAAYVFVRSSGSWSQQAYLKASNTDANDQFGYSVAISGDSIVVGARFESSNATGVNGDQSNNSAPSAGAAYVFVRSNGTWSQQAYLKASNTDANDLFGQGTAISGDTIVVGAPVEASNATGVNGNQADNSATHAGAAYVFVRSGNVWSQQAYLKASNTDANDIFGEAVAISSNTIVVGAFQEASNATGVNGNQADNSAANAGAAYVFVRSGSSWSQQAYLKASNTDASDFFGWSVAISGDTIVVGAPQEDSNATGVNGNQADNSAGSSGAAYVFVRTGSTWTQQSYLKESNTDIGDFFGQSVGISGEKVAVGASNERSAASGLNGNQADNSLSQAGAAYFFAFTPVSFANVSTRGNVGAGDNVLIAGVIVQGDISTKAVFRGIGPSLADFNVPNTLQNPVIDVYDSNGIKIAHNDNWMEEPDGTINNTRAAEITATGLAPSRPTEAAILMTIAPGAYTVILKGVGGTSGLGLVEVYGVGTPL